MYRNITKPHKLKPGIGKADEKKQVLQQEAYPTIWRPVDAKNSAIPGAINRKIGENLPEMWLNCHAKFYADR